MPEDRAHVVVAGCGIAGASIAYHLASLGCRDVLVLERGDLLGGTTSHAPGLVGQLRSDVSLTRMLMYSVELYRSLTPPGGIGFDEVGSLRLASSAQRLTELVRQSGFARGVGLETALLGPAETVQAFPLLNPRGIHGALYLPSDGSARATVLAAALIERAREMGVRFAEHTPITGIDIVNGRVRTVRSGAASVEVETLIIAAGIWSPVLARMAGVALPLTPMQHQYMTVGPIPDLDRRVLPNVRDPDLLVYARQSDDMFVIGGYERTPAVFPVDAIPSGPASTVLAFDETQFQPLLRAAAERIPAIATCPVQRAVNGLESFTPDGEFLLGPTADVAGLWFACGFCAHGVSSAGGVGRLLAEWIVEGEPSLDLWHMDVRRIGTYAASRRYVQQRAAEVYATYYDVSYPQRERSSVRNLRRSALHGPLRALGAHFGEKAGWERPNWFTPNEATAPATIWPRGWAAHEWSPAVAAEHIATRECAALFDVSSFAKLEVEGPGALDFLERVAANRMDRPIGAVTYTQLLNARGGIACDLTVTRLAGDRFMLITGAAFGTHDLGWLRSHRPAGGSVQIRDVTSSLCCVGLWGPLARDILQAASDDDVSNEAFPYLTCRRVAIGPAPALALRVTYVGELGWEIYAPTEYGGTLWETLWEAGRQFGAVAAGYRAIDSLRLEKGYRYWSADITGEYTPDEAGLSFAVRPAKGDFIGRDALLAARRRGPKRRLCCLVLEDPSAWVLGGEAILDRGQVVGRVTSGGYGYTVEASIAYGYLPVDDATAGAALEVLWFGERIPARVAREPLYDPANARVKEVPVSAAAF